MTFKKYTIYFLYIILCMQILLLGKTIYANYSNEFECFTMKEEEKLNENMTIEQISKWIRKYILSVFIFGCITGYDNKRNTLYDTQLNPDNYKLDGKYWSDDNTSLKNNERFTYTLLSFYLTPKRIDLWRRWRTDANLFNQVFNPNNGGPRGDFWDLRYIEHQIRNKNPDVDKINTYFDKIQAVLVTLTHDHTYNYPEVRADPLNFSFNQLKSNIKQLLDNRILVYNLAFKDNPIYARYVYLKNNAIVFQNAIQETAPEIHENIDLVLFPQTMINYFDLKTNGTLIKYMRMKKYNDHMSKFIEFIKSTTKLYLKLRFLINADMTNRYKVQLFNNSDKSTKTSVYNAFESAVIKEIYDLFTADPVFFRYIYLSTNEKKDNFIKLFNADTFGKNPDTFGKLSDKKTFSQIETEIQIDFLMQQTFSRHSNSNYYYAMQKGNNTQSDNLQSFFSRSQRILDVLNNKKFNDPDVVNDMRKQIIQDGKDMLDTYDDNNYEKIYIYYRYYNIFIKQIVNDDPDESLESIIKEYFVENKTTCTNENTYELCYPRIFYGAKLMQIVNTHSFTDENTQNIQTKFNEALYTILSRIIKDSEHNKQFYSYIIINTLEPSLFTSIGVTEDFMLSFYTHKQEYQTANNSSVPSSNTFYNVEQINSYQDNDSSLSNSTEFEEYKNNLKLFNDKIKTLNSSDKNIQKLIDNLKFETQKQLNHNTNIKESILDDMNLLKNFQWGK